MNPEPLIQPQPVPWQAIVQHGRDANGSPIVMLTIISVTGQTVVFCGPEIARKIAVDLVEHAKRAADSLIIPQNNGRPKGNRL